MKAQTPDTLTMSTSLVITLIVGFLHYGIFKLVYRFVDIFDEFGGELPWITRLLVESPFYYWVFPSLVAVAMVIHHSGHLSRRLTLLFSTIGTAVNTSVCVIALYLPIFQLGSMVTEQ